MACTCTQQWRVGVKPLWPSHSILSFPVKAFLSFVFATPSIFPACPFSFFPRPCPCTSYLLPFVFSLLLPSCSTSVAGWSLSSSRSAALPLITMYSSSANKKRWWNRLYGSGALCRVRFSRDCRASRRTGVRIGEINVKEQCQKNVQTMG